MKLSACSADAAQTLANTSADQPATNLEELVSLFDFEEAAERCISHMVWEYYSGVADEITLRWNREAYDRLRLRPRVLVDVSKIDTRTRLFGQELAHPILLAPAADHRMIHPDGEAATARGAGSTNTIFVLSSFTNTCVEDVARHARAPTVTQSALQPAAAAR